ncbi:MAG: hypothetical protein JSW50_06010 [Candidatus Latescibacterota bacterium]|nr:MAG: hypothetical protein JSW50_06010 [Candidatus Latescibacterota bacterium]
MKKLLILCLALFVVVSCGKKEDDKADSDATDHAHVSPEGTPPGEPMAMIPGEEFSEMERLADAKLNPYFDENASKTELAVAPGERFDLYVFAEYNKNYPMSAAEYRVILPEGVSILASTNCDSTILQFGNPEGDFMIAFHCSYGPKMWLVKYDCSADESFTGGKIRIGEGMALRYLGFAMCDESKTLIRAKPGEAVLRAK